MLFGTSNFDRQGIINNTVALANARPDAAAGSSGGFELVASYGDFDETTALEASTAWRMILVLRHAA